MKIPHLCNSLLSFLRVLDDEKANVKQMTAMQGNHLSKLHIYPVVEEILVELFFFSINFIYFFLNFILFLNFS